MRARSTIRILLLWIASCVLVNPAASSAKDLKALSEFVIPAYTAMQFAVFCSRDDPWFLPDTSGPRGTVHHYAQHVKDEAIESLTHDEAAAVLKDAAGVAREITRIKIRELVAADDDVAKVRAVKSWCDAEGKSFIRVFIEEHDREHTTVSEFLRRAKQ